MAEELKYYRHYIIADPATDAYVLNDGEIAVYQNGTDIRLRLGDGATQVKDLPDFIAPRRLEVENETGAYQLVEADDGKYKTIDAGLTIPTGLPIGFSCTIWLDNIAAQAVDTTGLTVEGNDANAKISAKGIITMAIIASDTVLIAGEMEA